MAKKPAPAKKPEPVKVNKSKAVRDVMAANPAATPKEVSAILTKQGIEVSHNYVYDRQR